jgi:hypothetical protein
MKYCLFSLALLLTAASVSPAQQTQVKTGNYTIVSTDAGNIIAFNCSSACTATLSSASSLGSMFTVRLLSYGAGTVTISSTSMINGGTTLLKGGSALISSDGSALYSGTTKSYVANSSNGTSDSINNAVPGTSFTSTVALPANLPVGTRVHIMHSGKYTLTAGSVNSELAVRGHAEFHNGHTLDAQYLGECHSLQNPPDICRSPSAIRITHQLQECGA